MDRVLKNLQFTYDKIHILSCAELYVLLQFGLCPLFMCVLICIVVEIDFVLDT